MRPHNHTDLTALMRTVSRLAATLPAGPTAARSILEAAVGSSLVVGAVLQPEAAPRKSAPAAARQMRVGANLEDHSNETASRLMETALPVRTAKPTLLRMRLSREAPDELAEHIAEQLAMVLDRAHLEEQVARLDSQAERRIREVTTVYEIGRAIDSVEFDRLLTLVTEKAARVMDAQACSLMRLDPDTNTLSIQASSGLPDDVVAVTRRALGEGIAGRVALTGEPMLINDSHTDPRLDGVRLSPEIGSSMVVPMKDEKGFVTGVLCISRRRPAPDFQMEDLRLLSVVAGQAALAISNKQLYDDLASRVRELDTLSKLTQAVISHQDIGELLENVADSITQVVGFDRCAIYLLDRTKGMFIPRVQRGYRPEVLGRHPVRVGEGVVGLVARRQEAVVEREARNAAQPYRGFARSLGVGAFVAIPIVAKGQSIGVVIADNKLSGRPIHDDSPELLKTLANQAGLAFENGQLSEEREQKYQEMNRLATQTDNILRSIAASVVVVDADGRVTRWNRPSEEMWGVPETEALGRIYSELLLEMDLPQEEADRLLSLVRRVGEDGRPYQGFKIGLHPKSREELTVNVLISPLTERDGRRHGVVQIVEDVTPELRKDAEILRMRRLADIGQLAAKMAHEVRNPLSSIKGAAQLIRNEYENERSLCEFVDIIIDEVNGLSRITTDLLDFARPMQLDLRPTNLENVALRTRSLLEMGFQEQGVRINIECSDDLPEIPTDQRQMEQVLRNIFLNAAQSMPDGGEISVQIAPDPTTDTVRLQITDQGGGIPPERLDAIFQPFFTTKTKGTGLGLPIVRKIVENHGGTIRVHSTVGEGSTFVLNLPLVPTVRSIIDENAVAHETELDAPIPDAYFGAEEEHKAALSR